LSKIAEWKDFVDECVMELKKVTWPDRTQAMNATWVIIIFVILVSAVIWVMDIAVRSIVNGIMGLFGA
jgi:preprotein translocase SecE subunit